MFPIGRKQALAAQKMQQLQPHLKELQDKFKDDKERLTKETFALYKKHGVNPVAGCLPALIQLPIFVGLWQALNTSFPLRHAPFLWIRDLAAPDMLFRFPRSEVPFLGHWFNVLPFRGRGLDAGSDQALRAAGHDARGRDAAKDDEIHDDLHGFHVLQGALGAGALLHHEQPVGDRRAALAAQDHARPAGADSGASSSESAGDSGGGKGPHNGFGLFGGGKGNGDGNGPKDKPPGRLAQFMERVLDEARKDPTYRKIVEERDGKSSDSRRARQGSAPAQAAEAVRTR